MATDPVRTITAGDERRAAGEAPRAPARPRRKIRAFWLKQLHTWHWVSAAASLAGMMLFAITGLTLNHAASIGAEPRVTRAAATIDPALVARLAGQPADAPLPREVASAVAAATGVDPGTRPAEWSDDEAYVAMPGPGRDAWVSVDRRDGRVATETTWRGWVSYLNDLHKGRNTGTAWSWFIDAFAVACILFTLTGLLLLQLHARHRPSTWPLVGFSLALPVIVAVFLIH